MMIMMITMMMIMTITMMMIMTMTLIFIITPHHEYDGENNMVGRFQ